MQEAERRMEGYSAADEVAKLAKLRDDGTITAEEYETMKQRAPLVFAFHPFGMNAQYMQGRVPIPREWPEALAVYPQGLPRGDRGFQPGWQTKPGELEDRDLVFFDTINSGVRQLATHVGIVIGGDEFVHAPSSTGEVRVERLASTYWAPRFLGARRVQ